MFTVETFPICFIINEFVGLPKNMHVSLGLRSNRGSANYVQVHRYSLLREQRHTENNTCDGDLHTSRESMNEFEKLLALSPPQIQ